MKSRSRRALGTLALITAGLCARPLAAQKLEAVAGAIGGVPTGPNGPANVPGSCSTYGPPAPIGAFFGSAESVFVPQGGTAFCGYSGDVSDQNATVGPLAATQSVGPVILGNPGFAGFYTGSASANADFWTLGAEAHGTITDPGSGSPVALASSSGAAFFQDTFTLSGLPPFISASSSGFVRYTFDVHGSLSTRTTAIPFNPADAIATLGVQHDPGTGSLGTFPLVSFHVAPGSDGTISSLDGNTAGFVPGPSSISGAGTFTSAEPNGFGGVIDFPITFGTPFSLKAGLMASVAGNGDSVYSSTATLTRIDLFDINHNPLPNYTVTGASGKVYSVAPPDAIPPTTSAIPSPGPNGNGWNNTNVTVMLQSVDNSGGSGVKEIHYALNGAPSVAAGNSVPVLISAEGVTTLTYFAVDNAGNAEAPKALIVQIDKTVPTATATVSPSPNVNGWNNTNVTVTITGSDAGSGIASCTAPILLTSEGAGQSASGTCTDKAGNASAPAAVTVNIEKTPPAISDFRVLFGAESYSLIGSPRNRLPWQITGIQVVFTKPITSAGLGSLSGISATGLSGVGTNTLTWTFNPIALGDVIAGLAGSGANALSDIAGNALGGGAGFSQRVRVLQGDANDDGIVNASDLVTVYSATASPYNLFDDINGDGAVNVTDVGVVRTRIGTSLP